MDDAQFQALMGQPPADDTGQQQAIVEQLRSDHNFGQKLSASPTLGAQGTAMQKSALSNAKSIGDRNQQGLTRTRQVEQDAIAETKRLQTLKGHSDITNKQNAAGEYVTWGKNNTTGEYEEIEDMRGLRDATRTGKTTFKHELSTGEGAFYDSAENTVTIPGYGTFKSLEEAEADSLARMAEGESNITAAEKVTEAQIEEVSDTITAVAALEGVYRDSERNVGNMIQAIDEGAETGELTAMLKSFTNATLKFESARENERLKLLDVYKMTPVSDVDYRALSKGAQPNLSPPQMKQWLQHKQEGLRRMKKANRVLEDFLRGRRRNHKGMPTDTERKGIQDEIDEILHDDYSFTHRFDGDEGTLEGADSGAAPLSTRPQDITESEWARLTPTQQRELGQQ